MSNSQKNTVRKAKFSHLSERFLISFFALLFSVLGKSYDLSTALLKKQALDTEL